MSFLSSGNLYAVVVSWLSYIKLPKAERYISGLEFAHDIAAKNVIDILIDYLKDMRFNMPAAAMIVNVQKGVSLILVIFTAHISGAYLGLFITIVLVNVFYLIGMVMFCIAAFVDSNNKPIAFVALFFLALGISGRDFLLETFLSDQRVRQSDPTVVEEDEVHRVSWSWRPYAKLLVSGVVLLLLLAKKVESKVVLIIAIAAVFAGYMCFLFGHLFYRKKTPTGGPLDTIIRVFKAAILKRHIKYPNKPSQPHENDERDSNTLLPSIPLSRRLDSAAALESSSISNEELETNDRDYQVKEVKRLLTMIPMWMTFLVCSVVGAAGETFFFEQSYYQDNHYIFVFFVICQALASIIASDMGKILSKLQFLKTRWRLATLVQIGIGMLCSLSCCIVAWRVEKFRLSTKDTVHMKVHMNVLWLTPQFVLLGCMEGFAEDGLDEFFKTQVSGSMRDYGPAFNEFILGIGKFISAILIVIFKDWFGEEVGEELWSSHLDRYYKFLVWLTFINFFLFVSVAVWYGNQQVEEENLIPISIILPQNSHSFPPQRSRLPEPEPFFTAIGDEKEEFPPQGSRRPKLKRIFTAIGNEKEVLPPRGSHLPRLQRIFTAIGNEKEA